MNQSQKLDAILENVIQTRQKLEDHVDNVVIHQVPPCAAHKGLAAKLWAITLLAIGSVVSALAALLK